MKEFLDELLVVLVVYEMKIVNSPAYHSLTEALVKRDCAAALFVYDNSTSAQTPPEHAAWSINYFHDPSNPGVSRAYNEGHRFAKGKNKKWMLLTDQDTVFPAIAFDEYQKSIFKFQPQMVAPILVDQFGIVSPFKFRFGGGRRLRQVPKNITLSLDEFYFVNSGLLISVDSFEQVNGYDEKFPLDFSDLDFAFRLRQVIGSFVIADFECTHELTSVLSAKMNEALARFDGYVVASRAFKMKHRLGNWLFLRALTRAIKLSWRFKNFKFMIVFIKKE